MNAQFKRQQLRGLSATDALIQDLKERGIHHAMQVDKDNRTRFLFIAYPESIKLARANQDVILVDCTYKTNKFELPLLHIVGTYIYGY